MDLKALLKETQTLASRAAFRFPGPDLRAAWIVWSDWAFRNGYPVSSESGLANFAASTPEAEKGVLRAIAFLIRATTLGAASPGTSVRGDFDGRLLEYLKITSGLNWDLIESNGYRREEAVRKWLLHFEIPIQGESEAESRERARDLDYRLVLAKAETMDQERESILKEWNRKIAEVRAAEAKAAAERAAQDAENRGSYE